MKKSKGDGSPTDLGEDNPAQSSTSNTEAADVSDLQIQNPLASIIEDVEGSETDQAPVNPFNILWDNLGTGKRDI